MTAAFPPLIHQSPTTKVVMMRSIIRSRRSLQGQDRAAKEGDDNEVVVVMVDKDAQDGRRRGKWGSRL
mgnify:CR=1 FL=1